MVHTESLLLSHLFSESIWNVAAILYQYNVKNVEKSFWFQVSPHCPFHTAAYPSFSFTLHSWKRFRSSCRTLLAFPCFQQTEGVLIKHKKSDILMPFSLKKSILSLIFWVCVCVCSHLDKKLLQNCSESACFSSSCASCGAAQHCIQWSSLLADASPRGDEVGVSPLVGEGVGRAPCRHPPPESTLPPLPLLLFCQVLLTVLLDLRACKEK